MNRLTRALITIGVLGCIWVLPVPQGVTVQAWHLFAIFVATIIGFILQPVPIGALSLISITFANVAGVLKMGPTLAAYGNPTIWLILSAFLIAKGLIKTGLGRRISYILISLFGSSTLKLSYALALSDLVIAPATPSNSARAGGVMYPIVRSLCSAFDSEPGPTARRVGAFLMKSSYHCDAITSAMFTTAMAGNLLAVDFAAKTLNIQITWGMWAMAALLPGIVALIAVPLFLYMFYTPELKKTPEAQAVAREELKKMGPVTRSELIVSCVFVGALLLWATSSFTKIDATLVAFIAVSVMLATDVLTWDDVLSEKSAWDTMFWIGTLMGLAGFLAQFGFIGWFSKSVASLFVGMNGITTLVLLVIVYVYSHYAFASLNGHITAMYPAFIAVAVAAGAPPFLSALAIGFAANLCMSLTHFAAGPTPIYFGAGYVSQADWWKWGFAISVLNLLIFGIVGSFWWKILGLW